MKTILNLILIAGLTFNSFEATAATKSLSSIILEIEYAQSSGVLTSEAKKELQSKFEAQIKTYLADKSDAQILSEVNALVADMPEGTEKKNFVNIIKENQASPADAMEEIIASKSFERMKAGDSANWSTYDLFRPTVIALAGVLVIAAVLIFNRKASKSKEEALYPDSYSEPQSGTFTFTGSDSERRQCWQETETDSNGTSRTVEKCEDCYNSTAGRRAEEDAEDDALRKCYNNPLMTVALCNSASISSSSYGSGDYCNGSATIFFKLQ